MKSVKLSREEMYHGKLILVNKDNPIKIKEGQIIEDLVAVCNTSHLLRKDAAELIHQLLEKIDSNNEIVPVSCFRTKADQEDIYNNSVKENGIEFTRKYVARPDESEHQSGLAIDLGKNSPDIDFICPYFPYYGVFNEFRDRAVRNGFIERYKEDKESITGISKEPWHFRYIGYPHSVIIEEKGFCFEEYHDFLKESTSMYNGFEYKDEKYIWKTYYIKARQYVEYIEISDDYDFDISGNNSDGFIITQCKLQ